MSDCAVHRLTHPVKTVLHIGLEQRLFGIYMGIYTIMILRQLLIGVLSHYLFTDIHKKVKFLTKTVSLTISAVSTLKTIQLYTMYNFIARCVIFRTADIPNSATYCKKESYVKSNAIFIFISLSMDF